VAIDHFNTDSQSVLVYATDRGFIHGWDLRQKKGAWVMHNKPDLGSLKTFLIDPLRNWLITVTSRGFYTCWDLRFLIPIKTWRHSIATKHSIYRVAPSPPSKQQNSRSSPLFFAATGGNEVQLWDIESAVTRQVLRAMPEGDPQPQSTPAIMYNPHSQDFGTDDLQRQMTSCQPSMRAILTGPSESTTGMPSYVITAGTDRQIRYWDLSNVSRSFVIAGPASSPVFSTQTVGPTTFFLEQASPLGSSSSTDQIMRFPTQESRGKLRTPVHHKDTILDLEMLELPTRLLVSGSRDGKNKVWK